MAKGKAVKAAGQGGVKLVREIAQEVGDAVSRKPKQTPWGWRGGKPGEITAGSVTEKDILRMEKLGKQIAKNEGQLGQRAKSYLDETAKYSSPSSNYSDHWHLAKHYHGAFQGLEKAGVPREFTGKVMVAAEKELIGWDLKRARQLMGTKNSLSYKELPQAISDALRPLSDEGRDYFLKMLPTWESSLDELAQAVSNILL
jgi:bisphosphoglycerate-dependent phosphoglycerate mutase